MLCGLVKKAKEYVKNHETHDAKDLLTRNPHHLWLGRRSSILRWQLQRDLFPSGFNTRKLLLSVHEMRKLSHFSTENESLFVFMYRNEVVASFLVPRSLLRLGASFIQTFLKNKPIFKKYEK